MAILYKKIAPKRQIPNYSNYSQKRLARELEPVSNGPYIGNIDIINDFQWTLTPNKSRARLETPFIFLTEYYMVDSAINQLLKPYGMSFSKNNGTQDQFKDLLGLASLKIDADTNRLYEGIFDLQNPSGFKYRLPFFTQENYSLSNSWEKKDILDTIVNYQKTGFGSIGKMTAKAVAKAAARLAQNKQGGKDNAGGGYSGIADLMDQIPDLMKEMAMLSLQMNNPAVGLLDPPHVWKQSAPREYNFSFFLYNTESIGQEKNDTDNLILKNWEFCYMLTYQNLVNKRNFFTGLPPVYYSVHIPGVHYCKASYMKNITISNVGNVRRMSLPVDGGPIIDVNIPDAYKIDITMQDMLMPSKNLFDAVTSVDKQITVSQTAVDIPPNLASSLTGKTD